MVMMDAFLAGDVSIKFPDERATCRDEQVPATSSAALQPLHGSRIRLLIAVFYAVGAVKVPVDQKTGLSYFSDRLVRARAGSMHPRWRVG